MKKNYLWAVLAGMALASCVSDEGSPVGETQKLMTFGTPVFKTQSRAGVLGEISGKKYPGEESFQVFAYSYSGNFGATTALNSYFAQTGEKASNAATDYTSSYWQTATSHYWPDAAHNLAFIAYSPADASLSGKVTHNDRTGLKITDFVSNDVSDEHYDLMYSNRVLDRNISNNGNKEVGLVFNHALSSIVFSAVRHKSTPETRITNIEIKSTKWGTKGTFDQGISETTVAGGAYSEKNNPSWSSLTLGTVNYVPSFTPFDVPTDIPTQFTKGTSAILAIPQDVPDDVVLKLTYETKTGSSYLPTTKEVSLKDFKTEKGESITKWDISKRYIYRISFGATSLIYFKPEVEDWTSHDVAIITINPGEGNISE